MCVEAAANAKCDWESTLVLSCAPSCGPRPTHLMIISGWPGVTGVPLSTIIFVTVPEVSACACVNQASLQTMQNQVQEAACF